MTKRSEGADGDATSSPESSNTVFIDTNLDTHLAMIVSHSDTVLHLKRKIVSEHPKCFPNCGDIIINALKVKRKGFFYHLSDSMLVRSAFEGAKKCRFLYVDASSMDQTNENQNPSKPEFKNQLASSRCIKTNSGDSLDHRAHSSSNKILYLCYPENYYNDVQKNLETEVKNVAYVEHKEGDSQVGVNKYLCNDQQESSLQSEPVVNKNRKSKKGKTASSNYNVKDADMDIDEHSSCKTVTEVPKDTEMEHINACNVVWKANNYHKDDNFGGVDKPLEESLRSGAIGNKKSKSKKMTEVSVSNFIVKNDNVDINVHSSGNTNNEFLVDVKMINTDDAKEDVEINTLDGNGLRSNTGEFLETCVRIKDDVSKNPVSDTLDNIVREEASKKRKGSKSRKADNPRAETNDNTPLINDVVPVISVPKFQKIKLASASASAENLITEALKDINLRSAVASSGEKKKKRRKKKSSKDQNMIVEPPSSHNQEEERCKEDTRAEALKVDEERVEMVTSDMDKASEPNDQLAKGLDLKEHDDANVKAKVVVPELGPESAFIGSKKTKKHHSSKVKELPQPIVTESGNLREEDVFSGDQPIQEVKINGPDGIKNQRIFSHNHGIDVTVPESSEQLIQGEGDAQSKKPVGSANLADISINIEHGKFVSSKRLKKRAKKPVSTTTDVSSAECSANNGGERLSRNEDELLPLTPVNKSQENEEIMKNNLARNEDELLPLTLVNKSRENGEILKNNLVKEAERNFRVEEKQNKMDLEPNDIIGNEHGSLTWTSDSTQAPSSYSSDIQEGNFGVLNNQIIGDANDQVEKTSRKDDRINFSDYFSPRESDHEAARVEPLVNSMKKVKRSDIAVEAKKKIQEQPSLGNNHSTIAKPSSKRMGEVVNSSRREKSLLATRASIFWDYSSESSEDSDSNKKAPSDNSSSSSDSEGEDKSVLDSARNGEANDGRSQKATKTPIHQRVSMDVILRSSRRFKRAKLMAAQSQIEDMESQEVSTGPESKPL